MKVVKAKDGYMIDVLADEAPVAKKRKPKAKPKYKTNIQFITDLMSHSQQGALMQAYLIEAIHAYSKGILRLALALCGRSANNLAMRSLMCGGIQCDQ